MLDGHMALGPKIPEQGAPLDNHLATLNPRLYTQVLYEMPPRKYRRPSTNSLHSLSRILHFALQKHEFLAAEALGYYSGVDEWRRWWTFSCISSARYCLVGIAEVPWHLPKASEQTVRSGTGYKILLRRRVQVLWHQVVVLAETKLIVRVCHVGNAC